MTIINAYYSLYAIWNKLIVSVVVSDYFLK